LVADVDGEALLTANNGARAAARFVVGNVRYDEVVYKDLEDGEIWAVREENGSPRDPYQPDSDHPVGAIPCIAFTPGDEAATSRKHLLWRGASGYVRYTDAVLTVEGEWENDEELGEDLIGKALALGTAWTANTYYVFACFAHDDPEDAVLFRRSTNRGVDWDANPVTISSDAADEIALAAETDAGHIYVAYHYVNSGEHTVRLWRSADQGGTWTNIADWTNAAQPCIAVHGDRVVVSWVEGREGTSPTVGGRIKVA
jgi:hypothetical protein